jgi:hypothetical protein
MADLMPSRSSIPADDLTRYAALVDPEDPNLPHVGIGTGTYTVLIGGDGHAGRYTLIDMLVPPNGGPPPHRHDFEEMFHVLEGRTRSDLPGRAAEAPRRAKPQHTCQRAARVPGRLRHSSPVPVPLSARRVGGVLPGGRRPPAQPDHSTAGARR